VASVSVPQYEPCIVNRWAFRTLAERAETFVSDPDDEYKLKQAVALDGLHFDLLPADQCARLALAVERAADELRAEFRLRDTPTRSRLRRSPRHAAVVTIGPNRFIARPTHNCRSA
jgi:hypothetical protein